MSDFPEEVEFTLDIESREAQRKALATELQQREHQLDTDYQWLMESFAGRRVIWDLVSPMFRISYDGTEIGTQFREGERNVALRIWARLLRVAPTLAHKLLQENQK